MYQLIIFDWDGTLMDSASKIANCIHASAEDAGLPGISDQKAKSIIGLGLNEAMQTLYPDAKSSQLTHMVERYRYHFVTGDQTEQRLFDGVLGGLQSLSDAGALLAVATGKSRVGLKRVLDEMKLHDFFVTTRCADESRSKPHPQMLLDVMEATAMDAKDCIMVGDTSFDMTMAKAVGMDTLAVSYGVHSEKELESLQPTKMAASFTEVLSWLSDNRITPAYADVEV